MVCDRYTGSTPLYGFHGVRGYGFQLRIYGLHTYPGLDDPIKWLFDVFML